MLGMKKWRFPVLPVAIALGACVGFGMSFVLNNPSDVAVHLENGLIVAAMFGVVGLLMRIAQRQK
jgi:hypothetical protein